MMSWWTDINAVALLNNMMLIITIAFAALTGLMAFLSAGKTKSQLKTLSEGIDTSRKQIKTLEKTAENIRKELLETQQHHDINQLKLKTSTSSAAELRQELLDARQRLETAEAAVKAHQEEQAANNTANNNEEFPEFSEIVDLEPESTGGLSENQREQLIDLLDPGPKGNIDIICVLGDPVSELTAKQLEEILSNDGWKTSSVTQSAFSNPPQGIVLAVNSKETAPSYASFLQRVFSTIDMTVSARFDSKFREWSLTVIVGIDEDA
jgi:hypothetical protein